jgi:hypothetical protein
VSDFNLSACGPATVSDFFHAFVGRRLGEGIGREVFEFIPDRSKVVKLETVTGSFQNIIEWETWHNLAAKHRKWLAPCRFISPCGIVLLMDRTEPLRPGDIPARIPEWLSDLKRENYGILDGKFVCHDYGTNLLLNHGAFAGKLVKRSRRVK